MATKPCKECGAVKPLDGFPRHKEMADGHLNRCKVCQTAYLKAYGEKNKTHLQEAAKNRYEANKGEILKRVREHWHKNADAINARRRARYANDQEHREKVLERCRISNAKTRPTRRKKRRKNDPAYLYLERYRRRMWHALKGRGAKSASTLELIGCSGEELERYLETTKVPGKDYTICHVDHIIPVLRLRWLSQNTNGCVSIGATSNFFQNARICLRMTRYQTGLRTYLIAVGPS